METAPGQTAIIGTVTASALRVVDDSFEAERVATPAAAEIDDFGFDRARTERLLPLARWFYRHYWRVETEGVHHVPGSGPALLVANHSGVIPYDGAMIRTALMAEHPQPRHARMLVMDWAFSLPFVADFMRRTGNVLAHPDNAAELLRRGELVGVFPEGARGSTKPFRERYQVGRLGRSGFVQVAIRTGAPIVPVSVVGGEEIHPVLHRSRLLATLLGVPAFPITPTFPLLGPLGLVPLPSKWLISFGKPILTARLGPAAADDPSLCLEMAESVRERIQAGVVDLLARRRSAFH